MGRTDTRPHETSIRPGQTRPSALAASFSSLTLLPFSAVQRQAGSGSSASGPTGAPCSLPRKPPAAFLLPLAMGAPAGPGAQEEGRLT